MRILGIDPGTRSIGIALLMVGAAPEFSRGAVLLLEGGLHERLRLLRDHLEPFLAEADLVVAELPYMGGPSTTIHHVARALGYIEALAVQRGLPFHALTPSQIRAQFGSGRAQKEDVQYELLWQIRGLPARAPHHLYDAVAAAWAGALLHPSLSEEEAQCRVRVFSPENAPAGRG
ncbi:MAG: crossover junction endodeoxyribonuclease RuvC [Clostridiales bacterium]|nr:crossover junction endodeoxyribonuclease RuvC [Clostridiales bacterium]